MAQHHYYRVTNTWTGNKGKGTSSYRAYDRSHVISALNKQSLPCSSDSSFRGDATKYNPEELLVASVSACHMLWYLHLCADAGVIVVDYVDEATGTMETLPDGSGHFTEVVLHPKVTIANAEREAQALGLHEQAHQFCFIANSVNFPIRCKAQCLVVEA